MKNKVISKVYIVNQFMVTYPSKEHQPLQCLVPRRRDLRPESDEVRAVAKSGFFARDRSYGLK